MQGKVCIHFYLSIDVTLCLLVCTLFSFGFPYQVALYPPAFKHGPDLKALR